jgi:adenylate kinase
MIGPPGAGKGTQAEQIASARGIPKISTGDILREAVQNDTEIGRRAHATMSRGELVSDEVMIDIVRERLNRSDALGGFVLDGFPRTVAQARALDRIVGERGALVVIEIVVPEAELVRRMTTRMVCESCAATADAESAKTGTCQRCGGKLVQRSDDNEAVIRERLRVYHRQTQPLVEYYQTSPAFRSVNGAQTPDRVAADVLSAVDSADSGATKGV